jgi:Fic family protein
MQRGPAGEYRIDISSGEAVRAFVPKPLPPQPALVIEGARGRLLERATLAVGRLDSISALLPDPQLFLYTYVRREAVVSSQIEGTQSTLAQLLLFELDEAPGVPIDDVQEVSNYVAALEHGMQRMREGYPLSNRLLREMHGKLLSSGRGSEKLPGQFRRTQNWIGGTRPGNAQFIPAPPQELENCMAALERYIHAPESPYPALIDAALVHVQFETIHPFLDGNGRIGRLLIALMLQEKQVLREPLLYLSLFFKRHRAEYYRRLDAVRTAGDWEGWLDFFLEGVAETADGAVRTAQRLTTLFERDAEHIRVQGLGDSALLVLQCFRRRPLATLAELRSMTGKTLPTITKAVTKLVESGIVREITGRRRRRVYAYAEYLAVLNEGGEAL